jgi:hypothetical protein
MQADRLGDHPERDEPVGVDPQGMVLRGLLEQPDAGLLRPPALLDARVHGDPGEFA